MMVGCVDVFRAAALGLGVEEMGKVTARKRSNAISLAHAEIMPSPATRCCSLGMSRRIELGVDGGLR